MWKIVRTCSQGGQTSALVFLGNCVKSKEPFGPLLSRGYSLSGRKWASEGAAVSRGKKQAKKEEWKVPPGGWLLLVIPVSTLALGVWQVYRWRWKLGLIAEMHQKSIADPVSLPDEEDALEELEYRKVSVRGEFDYLKELLMGPRALINPNEKSGEMNRGVFSSGAGNNGYHVITPFKLEGKDESILVNRGWINSRNPAKFKHVQGPVEVVGIVRKGEKRAPFVSKNRPGQNLLHYRDVPTMAQLLGSKEVFLDLYSIQGVDFSNAREDSIPVPRQTRVTLRNEHVSYFVTWFSLSAITSFMWHRRFIRGLNLL